MALRSLLTLMLLSTFSVLFAQTDCVLRKDEDSIKVYTCHNEGSKFKSIKSDFTINTTFSTLVSMVLNIDNYNQWQYNTVNPKILKRISDHEIIYYVEVEAPWPVSNRDMIIHLIVKQDPTTKTVTMTADSEPDYIPHKEGLVRVPMSKSTWTVKRLSSKKLEVHYAIKIDPGGSVPAWMVNMVCAEAPYVSFSNLKSKIKSLKNNPAPFIVD
ncbi:MAG TPA: START domain-containing protein [Cyclobacteriaceae bacterium]|nr:START domain-containing protein [Cyclobacteriaceae bacterium]